MNYEPQSLREARLAMVQELDRALHDEVIARPLTPEQTWGVLLQGVRDLRDSLDRMAYQRRRDKEEGMK